MGSYKRKRSYNLPDDEIREAKRVNALIRKAMSGGGGKPGLNRRKNYNMSVNEVKYFDTAIDEDIPATWEVQTNGSLNLIGQGNGESNRIGKTALIQSISVNGELYRGSTIWQGGYAVAYLMLDTECNGSAASATDIFKTTGVTSFMNLTNSHRFKIIKKIKFIRPVPNAVINSVNDVLTTSDSIPFSFTKVFTKPIPVTFSSTNGAISEIRNNNFFWVYCSDQVNKWGFKVNNRVRFTQ